MSETDTNNSRTNLTASQYRIWLGQKLAPEIPLYNMVTTFRIAGPVDVDRFQLAYREVQNKADAFRLVFSEEGGIPRQHVLELPALSTGVIDLSTSDDPECALQDWVNARRGFIFRADGPMLASTLLKIADDEFVWYLNQHHLITDAWSTMVAYARVARQYQSLSDGRTTDPGAMPSYMEFVEYEAALRQTPRFAKAQRFWQERTQAAQAAPQFYGRRQTRRSTETERVTIELDARRSSAVADLHESAKLRSLTKDWTGLNVFLTILAAWQHRISGQERVAIGTMVHNRSTAAMRDTVGLFVELFPVVIDVEPGDTFLDVLRRIQRETMEVLPHAIPGASAFTGQRPFQTVLNYNTVGFGDFAGFPMTPQWIHAGHGDPDHLLRLQVHDFGSTGRLCLHFDFNTEVFSLHQRQRAVHHFTRMLDAFLTNPDALIADVDLLSDLERVAVRSFSAPAESLSVQATVVDMFRRQVDSTPAAVAIEENGATLTYEELDRFSDSLIAAIETSAADSTTVGICMPRSPELAATVLAVLKSGRAYLPLATEAPPARLRHMLQDSNCRCVLTADAAFVKPDGVDITVIDVLFENTNDLPGNEPASQSGPRPDDVAYVMYTSGSTGVPKGVIVDHRALAHYVNWARNTYVPGEPLDFALFTSFAFDLTVTSLFVPLVSGGRIVIYREDTTTEADISVLDVFQDSRVDVVKLTPSHLALLRDLDLSESRICQLIVGGEDFRTQLARDIHAAFQGDVTIWNEYGPTEATVACAVHQFDPIHDVGSSVPIGRPAAHASVFVADGNGRDCPIGVTGELCIAGAGVARGYLNQPELTAARFVTRSDAAGGRFYRSGDVGRWREDGVLEYLGRRDRQVKLNGVRMELTEIEAVMRSHPDVRDCAVDVLEGHARPAVRNKVRRCSECGIADEHPDVEIDQAGVCNICVRYRSWQSASAKYFRESTELQEILDSASRENGDNPHDCLMMLSGGKDSTYALYRVVEMGAKPLVFTLDNGYISRQAMDNIRRVAKDLKLELVVGSTPSMNAIFVDSLKRFGNVCNGCFKTIYTLATNVAAERGIRLIITGLSRGQIFETRLSEFYRSGIFDPDEVDHGLIEARKAYHRASDAVSRLMDVERFRQDDVFDQIRFVDFYRYCDVELAEMLKLLSQRGAWRRPDDTGRSTNCLINVAGIHVHKNERGYHNYAAPYAWDVRLRHKTREEAIAELDDEIDESEVARILGEIGYEPDSPSHSIAPKRLTAWYVADSEIDADLRSHLRSYLPAWMIPGSFHRRGDLPLTANGKVDRAALLATTVAERPTRHEFSAPRNVTERTLAAIWQELFRAERIGIHDDFFELGGDSILSLQVVARAALQGLRLTPAQLFEHPTIAELAGISEASVPALEAKAVPQRLNSLSEGSLSRLAGLLGGDAGEAADIDG